ncbi:restriction endonuclease subunit S [Actinobacillus equuli]|uniref:restriction endonuclease subunit S n=1 Tax=Actinobacillus equuli TaxID=718 RepID=UPI002442B656|nr:restriction endonuclease subunit S [Actinobacillus equuli]WGE52912.1 restriction endonuclease subunit S [Actinobacillus equuli subsp. haemolyticus]WGE73348.1 restriction endonuclease subunit S [Actinobacillus equuli subsp. haemolyticus]
MKYLHEISFFVSEKINSSEIELQNYVTTDNLLQNKEGVTLAVSLPVNNTKLTKYEKGDILVSNIRPYLRKIWFANKSGGCSNDVLVFRAKENNDPAFLYYSLLQNNFFDFVMSGAKGTKMPRGDKSQMMNFGVSNFELSTQQKIAQVLSTLDRKIALNQQINAELEKMAKTLYDYWFVQFDFPDENGNPYKSSGGEMVYHPELKREVPKGWVCGNIMEIANLLGGGTPSKNNDEFWNGNIPFFTPTDCNNDVYILSTKDNITAIGLEKSSTKLFPENTILLTARGSVGKLSLNAIPMAMNQSCYALMAKDEISYSFLYFLARQLIHILEIKATGSVFNSIVSNDIENTFLTIPEKIKIQEFGEICEPIFEKIKTNTKETQKLTQLRDFLLPMLMNGQVEVA